MPHAVICLLSSLQLHGLTMEVPHAVWVLIDRHARMAKLGSPRLGVVRASGAVREHGVQTRRIEGEDEATEEVSRLRLPQNILLTIWASDAASWAGPIDGTTAPAFAEVDGLRVYSYAAP